MAFWVIRLAGQDARQVYARVSADTKRYRKKPLEAATHYATQNLANAAITTLGLGGKHPEAVAIQRT